MAIKIGIITATRAEYGILQPLIFAMMQDSFFEIQLIVTGTHLLEKYGNTVTFIEDDGLPIRYRIPIMTEIKIDANEVISKAICEFSKIYRTEQYDAILILGDRYELYGFCIPAMFERIPIIHLHGGEKTEGAVDEKVRHSVTKMASIHFPSIQEYANRIIQMGENPKYVFPVGALGIDNTLNLPLISKQELQQELGVDFNKDVAIVTFHPVTLDSIEAAQQQIVEVFDALVETKLICIVTMPNSDSGGEEILKKMQRYFSEYPEQFVFRQSLGQNRYFSVLKYAKLVIGNSSSGIIESASFHIPTIDIGDRQKGRFAPKSVLHCECNKQKIKKSIQKGLDEKFRKSVYFESNPYGDGKTALKIISHLKKVKWDNQELLRKQFYDIPFEVEE